ncbi:hypothetical protein [Pseudoruegeria sp. SK021]|uniref:hypothetical protein n=1 Tax=Pseudoruegeria sp. SK021 TaxID=1933035 RepID=UPI000A21C2B1|nr:hypothetical protein [Pseudoruegeria sp. SK021]OSP53418.1 hypothetical protein BV911_18080 [Pseudoruegeria sp. SK021]
MDRLSLFVAMMTWTLVSGIVIVLFMSLGYIGWVQFGFAVALGFGLGLPLAKMISARIKRRDPDWDEKRNRPDPARDTKVGVEKSEPRRRV